MVLYVMAAALLASAPNQAFSEVATQDLNVKAGLAPALTFDCPRALSLGEAVAPQGDRGGGSTFQISYKPDGGLSTVNAQGLVITDGESTSGLCKVNGMPNSCYNPIFPGESVRVSPTPAAVGDLPPANESSDVKIKFTMFDPILVSRKPLDLGPDGQATFGVGGTIAILNNLHEDDFGGYAMTLGIELQPWDCDSEIM